MICVYGDYCGASGFVTHSVNLVRELRKLCAIEIRSINQYLSPSDVPLDIQALVRPDQQSEPRVAVFIGGLDSVDKIYARYKIAFVVFETTQLPAHILASIGQLDQVWVPSIWCRQRLIDLRIDPKKIRLVPEGVSPQYFASDNPAIEPFRFLCVGKWEPRKCQKQLIKAFKKAFRRDEQVQLVLHAHNPFINNFNLNKQLRWARFFRPHQIIASSHVPASEMPSLYRNAHVFVLATRGEAWGLPILEALASGLPVITTDYAGAKDFLPSINPLRLPVTDLVDVDDNYNFLPNDQYGQWAEPDWSKLVSLMRLAYDDWQGFRAEAIENSEKVRVTYAWSVAARIAAKAIGELAT